MVKDFDTLLDECLDRVLSGESLEQCLARYPQEAAQLKLLLEAALTVAQATATEPRPEFKARLRYQLLAAQSAPRRKEKKLLPLWLPRWALALGLLLALSLALGGTLLSAAASLPGEPLYPVKTATEEVQLALTPQEAPRAGLKAGLAEVRLQEMVALTRKDIEEEQRLSQIASQESREERAPALRLEESEKPQERPSPRREWQRGLPMPKQAGRLIRSLEDLEQRLAHHLATLERLAVGLQGRQKGFQAGRLKALVEQRLGPRLAELEEVVAMTSSPTREQAQKILEASRERYRRVLQTLEEIEKTQGPTLREGEPPPPGRRPARSLPQPSYRPRGKD